ncbi:MAG: hypothetical protein EBR40_11370 [Proteobacteria bacterium]|nr:hypothetical protein [Pseudomonadota bacterium]
MKPNLFDTKPIDRYLEGLAPADPDLQRLLKLALAKPLAKRSENLEPVTDLPADPPDWLKKKWPDGGPYHRFRPDPDLETKARHVADWLKAAIQDHEPWLTQLSHGRPTRFTAVNTLDDALAMADADMREKNKKLARQLAPAAEGEETVMDLGGGFRMVRLSTPTALDRESVAMGHCIGQGGYDKYLQDGTGQFFSLRDAKNEPHATIEVDTKRNAVLQCQGKENKPPVAKYLPYLQRFLTEHRYRLEASPSHTGLIEQNGQYHSIYKLPPDLNITGDLDLSNTPITALPKGLKVDGHLHLSGTRITELPEGLVVGGNLDLRRTPITALPKGLKVKGSLGLSGTHITELPEGLDVGVALLLSNTPITALPKGLKVDGHLYLNGTRITKLPKGLKVQGSLDLSNTPITALPEGLVVGRTLDLSDSQITALPEGLVVGGSLNLMSTPITALPEGLVVGGSLNLMSTPITALPKGLKVKGNLDLSNTPITALPKGLKVDGHLDLRRTPITALPADLQVGGDIHSDKKLVRQSGTHPGEGISRRTDTPKRESFQDRVLNRRSIPDDPTPP